MAMAMYVHVCNCSFFFKSILKTSTAWRKSCLNSDIPCELYFSGRIWFPPSQYFRFKDIVYELVYALQRYQVNEYTHSWYHCHVYTNEVEKVFRAASDLAWRIHEWRGYRKASKMYHELKEIAKKCSDVEKCVILLNDFQARLDKAINSIRSQIHGGRKALLSRFMNNTKRYLPIVEKYFPDLIKPSVEVFTNTEEAREFLMKFYDERRASRYATFLSRHRYILIMPHDIIALAMYHDFIIKYIFRVFVDSCNETESYAVCKIVYPTTDGIGVDRIEWVAVIGYDKLSNQRFLHYVPPSLALRNVETCRKWVMGLVDRLGRPERRFRYENIRLIET